MIAQDILIEELIREIPGTVGYLMEEGMKCIACGEPIWGTLEDAAIEKGFSEAQISEIVADLNLLSSRNLP